MHKAQAASVFYLRDSRSINGGKQPAGTRNEGRRSLQLPGLSIKNGECQTGSLSGIHLFIQFAICPSELLKLSFEECFSIVLLVAAGRTGGVNNFASDRD